jgi:hypothetical protein
MDENLSLAQLVVLRRLSRTLADNLGPRVKRHVATLAPLMRPRSILGEYIQSSRREPMRGAAQAFKELRAIYAAVAPAEPFFLSPELEPPLEASSTTVEIHPLEYTHVVRSGNESKKVLVTAPLKWAMTYSGYSIPRLRELLLARDRSLAELKESVLQYLLLFIATSKERGLSPLFDSIRFPIVPHYFREFGKLPIVVITSPAATRLPSDDTVLESTEISGADVFEEVVDVPALTSLADPFQERLVRLVRETNPDLLPL